MKFKYVVLQTEKEALNYLDSIKDTLANDIYEKAKDRILYHYKNDKTMTVKMIYDLITVLKIDKQGNYEEASKKNMEFAVENMNIWLREEGIVKWSLWLYFLQGLMAVADTKLTDKITKESGGRKQLSF